MDIINIARMLDMQKELQDKYSKNWLDITPENGHYFVLWAVAELGEMIDIIKKQGDTAIMEDKETRKAFIKEIVDVMMYLGDVLRCYDISAEEFSKLYEEKHAFNMTRWD